MTTPTRPPSEQGSEPARVPAQRSEIRRRSQQVAVRLSPDEHDELLRLCAANDMSPGAVLRAGLTLLAITEPR